MGLKVLNDKIIFQFVEDISRGAFNNKTDWGFQFVQNAAADVKKPRWGLVLQTGPEVQDVKEGNYVLIEPLMWTLRLSYEGTDFWYTQESKILALAEEEPVGIQ